MSHMWLCFCLLIGHTLALSKTDSSRIDDDSYLLKGEAPDPGPQMPDTVYIPGTPGGPWSKEEIDSTRRRVLKMITPIWPERKAMGLGTPFNTQAVTENKLIRLAFHDCIPYEDGTGVTGGCDGCLNWEGINDPPRSVFDKEHYKWKPIHKTNNQFLAKIAGHLEDIYTSINWPYVKPSLDVSLQQSGKSRADLWQFAALVALEVAIERSNRACDLDYHQRQQVRLLEGRTKCEIKLTKPLKFMSGRKDCITQEDLPYKTFREEHHPKAFGDGHDLIDYGISAFRMPAEHFSALQGIHGIVDFIHGIGTKYTWFGSGYISNTYFKQIVNKPMYLGPRMGGDQSFSDCIGGKDIHPLWSTYGNWSIGGVNGEPIANNGWRVQCWPLWKTNEGGPCILRPVPYNSWEAPHPEQAAERNCIEGFNSDGTCKIRKWLCPDAYCTKDNILKGAKNVKIAKINLDLPWNESMTNKAKMKRHIYGNDNRFAFPWEIGMYWNLTVGGLNQRAMGCPGIDVPFGTIDEPNWPYRFSSIEHPVYASPAMQCGLNEYKPSYPESFTHMHGYTPDNRPMHEIIDDLASDNEVFAEKFLEGWQMLMNNGYTVEELEDGPENGWFGYFSLAKQGIAIEPDFRTFIDENKPVWITDPTADPFLCGHKGHFLASCGNRFSDVIQGIKEGKGSCALNQI